MAGSVGARGDARGRECAGHGVRRRTRDAGREGALGGDAKRRRARRERATRAGAARAAPKRPAAPLAGGGDGVVDDARGATGREPRFLRLDHVPRVVRRLDPSLEHTETGDR